MGFELTKKYIANLKEAILKDDRLAASVMAEAMHPADIAGIMDELPVDKAQYFFDLLGEEKAAEVLIELDEDIRKNLLKTISSKEIARQFIDKLDSDDAADMISELPEWIKTEVIAHIEDDEQARHISDLLHYHEDTAGGLMAKELIAVNENWTALRCVKAIRKHSQEIDDVYAVYVVDDERKLLGTLLLSKLLVAPANAKIADLYNRNVHHVETTTDREEVALIMKKYDLVVIPVVDKYNTLAGRITIDDVVDVIKEEADKDYQMASGISHDVESSDKAWTLSRSRLPWLLIGLVGGICGAQVIGNYEEQIKIYPEMAFFIPLITAMGGNAGVQSSAIIVQGLANKTLSTKGTFSKLWKEFSVAMINGLICALLILIFNIFFSDSTALSFTVSFALLAVIVFATIFGTIVPQLLDRYKIDPALATGPFITTVNDVLGLVLYFAIGRILY